MSGRDRTNLRIGATASFAALAGLYYLFSRKKTSSGSTGATGSATNSGSSTASASANATTKSSSSSSSSSSRSSNSSNNNNNDNNGTARLFTLTNKSGMSVTVTNYGGHILKCLVPDRQGKLSDVVLGFDTVQEYFPPAKRWFGSTVGRYCGRIQHAQFSLNGETYKLKKNNGNHSLHGGESGFDVQLWQVNDSEVKSNSVVMRLTSPDGEEGFPGTLHVKLTYTLSEKNELGMEMEARLDDSSKKETVVNLCNHAYWNLRGADVVNANASKPGEAPLVCDVMDHELSVNARMFCPVDAESIPTGEVKELHGTEFDLTTPTRLGDAILGVKSKTPQGIDDTYVINRDASDQSDAIHAGALLRAALLHDPVSGRVMEVLTTQPALQVYTANYLQGDWSGKNKLRYGKHCGVCLETQNYPNAPNNASFPTPVLKPGQVYRHLTVHKFSVASGKQ